MNREQWLAERRKGIGGSDIAAACGLSPWTSAYELYLDKIGKLPERPPSAAMAMGTLLEEAIARAYMDRTGRGLDRVPYRIDRSERYPWMLASLDGVYGDRSRIVECKNISAYAGDDWGEPGTDQVPEHYAVQVQWQMSVTGIAIADLAVLIGGVDFRVYTVERNQDVINSLTTIGANFWRRVQERRPPDPDFFHPSTPKLLAHLYGVNEFLSVTLPDDAMGLVAAYETHAEAKAAHEDGRSQAKAQLLYMLGEASVGYLPDGRIVTRKQVTRKGYEVQETSYVDFRIRKGKKATI